MSVGAFLLSNPGHRQESAQTDLGAGSDYVCFSNGVYLRMSAGYSSTHTRQHVQNRYPSPLKRFACLGGPLFLCGERSAQALRQVLAAFGWARACTATTRAAATDLTTCATPGPPCHPSRRAFARAGFFYAHKAPTWAQLLGT